MTTIHRLSPGDPVPWTGTYGLVGHYGEPAGIAQWFDKGVRLPLATGQVEYPVWYAFVGNAEISSQAA
jgi:hypothetical protein